MKTFELNIVLNQKEAGHSTCPIFPYDIWMERKMGLVLYRWYCYLVGKMVLTHPALGRLRQEDSMFQSSLGSQRDIVSNKITEEKKKLAVISHLETIVIEWESVPITPMFEYLVPSWWNCLGRIKKKWSCGGGGGLFGVGLEVSEDWCHSQYALIFQPSPSHPFTQPSWNYKPS